MNRPGVVLEEMMRMIGPSSNPLAPMLEGITNSLESILHLPDDFERKISIELHFNDSDDNEGGKRLDYMIIEDSGNGFNDEAFTRFSNLLDKSKGFKNRGTGRLQYLHRFGEIVIESNFINEGSYYLRSFKCNKQEFISNSICNNSNSQILKTRVKFLNPNLSSKDVKFYSSLSFHKFVSIIKSHFALRAYLEKKKEITFPNIELKYSYNVADSETILITNNDLPQPSERGTFEVNYLSASLDKNSKLCWHIDNSKPPEKFEWLVFDFIEDEIDRHGAFLCSKDIPIEELENPVLKKSKGFKGTKRLAAFYGPYLDKPENVNHAVDSFNIKSKTEVSNVSRDLFDNDSAVYIDDIRKQANNELNVIFKEVMSAQKAAEQSVHKLAKELGISQQFVNNVLKNVSLNDDEDSITSKLLIEEARFIADKSNTTRKCLDNIKSLDPTSDDYREKLELKSKEVAELIDAQNKEELSKYVVRRGLVVKLLSKILKNELDVQTKEIPKGKNRDREGIIHDLIFKRKKTSSSINDLWILDEEFVHFDGFSETQFTKMQLKDGRPFLAPEALEEMKGMGFKPDRRPDVFLFADEGKCIVIEFKEPETDLADYLQQMPRYCQLIANYGQVKVEKFYCYLIGEKIFPEADLNEYEESVTGSWYRDSIPVRATKKNNRSVIANMRLEVIKLSDVAKRAHIRNKSFADKLGLDQLLDNYE